MPISESGGTGGYIPPGRLDRRDRGREDERDLEHPGPRLNRRDRGFRDRPQDPKEVKYPLPISGPGADIVDDLGDLEDRIDDLEDTIMCGVGDVIGPDSVTDGNLVVFDGTSGKLVKDGGTNSSSAVVWPVAKLVSNPQLVYTQRPQVVLFRAPANLTITRIHIHGNDSTPTAELAGDLKWADDVFDGSFTNATVIDVCDTTNGVFTATSSFDDATITSGKYIYFQMDSSPHADWKDFYIEFYYTLD